MKLTFEQVTMVLLLNLKCNTASQWCTSVFNICPLLTSHTLYVEKKNIPTPSPHQHSPEQLNQSILFTLPRCAIMCIGELNNTIHSLGQSRQGTCIHYVIHSSVGVLLECRRHTNISACTTNLIVESLEPVTTTLSSYCRQSTEPV